MTSPTPKTPLLTSHSQLGSRRLSSRPPSNLHSDCPPDPEDLQDNPGLGQRSVSLTTLQPTVIQPRMAQLETLEAKMASIEVSLSSSPRRKKNGSIGSLSSIRSIPKELALKELESLRNALRDKENIIQSLKGQLTIPGLRLSSIRSSSNNNNNNNNNSSHNNNGLNRELSEIEKKQAEERLGRLKTDVDNKRLAIKNLKMALERLDITDNIDVRIQQAELEYQLGREELNLLTLLEETRTLQHCLEESNRNSSDSHTLYTCVQGQDHVSLHAVEITYDPKSPRFGAGQKDSGSPGLYVDWALEETGICKGDRLIEVNGKIVLTKTREDLTRLLAAAPDPAQIVILRKHSQSACQLPSTVTANNAAREITTLRSELEVVRERAEEAQRVKDGLRSDNLRLTHRISYLEEQVSELINKKNSDDIRIITQSPVITSTVKTSQNVTNINISSQPSTIVANGTNSQNDLQVFQKGPQVTALVANIPGLETSKETHGNLPIRSKSSLSNVSNTHIPAPSPQPSDHSCHKSHRHKHRSSRNGFSLSASTQYLDQSESSRFRKHHHHQKDYSSETNSGVEYSRPHQNVNSQIGLNSLNQSSVNGQLTPNGQQSRPQEDNLMDQSYKRATKIVQELTSQRHNRESRESNNHRREATNNIRENTSIYEKHRHKCLTASDKYNTDLLKHYNARKSTSVIDFRSQVEVSNRYSESKSAENLDAPEGSADTNHNKRLYRKLHDARSVKSLDFDSDCNSTVNLNGNSLNHGHHKSIDYTSEPISNGCNKKSLNGGYEPYRPNRPMPPKKPIRLSLHRAQSLQSVETPPVTPSTSPDKSESRKAMKRTYKGDMSFAQNNGLPIQNGIITKTDYQNALNAKEKLSAIKWTSFGHQRALKEGANGLPQQVSIAGSWC